MSKKGTGKFVLGAALGAGLGLLFAPKKGKELRADLKEKIDEVIENIKSLDKDEVKDIKAKTEELVELAKEKGTPVLKKAAEGLRDKAVEVTKDVTKKLESIDIK